MVVRWSGSNDQCCPRIRVAGASRRNRFAQKSIEQRFEELDQEIRILKRKHELDQEAADGAKKSTAPS